MALRSPRPSSRNGSIPVRVHDIWSPPAGWTEKAHAKEGIPKDAASARRPTELHVANTRDIRAASLRIAEELIDADVGKFARELGYMNLLPAQERRCPRGGSQDAHVTGPSRRQRHSSQKGRDQLGC
jgi:hypothetical protein